MVLEYAAASAFMKNIGRIFQVLENEYKKQKGLREEVQSIQQDFLSFGAAMDDWRHGLVTGEFRTAVERLHSEAMLGLARDAQDCIERIVDRLTWRPRVGQSATMSQARRLAHGMKKVTRRSAFADEIAKLKIRIGQERKRLDEFKPNTSASSSASSRDSRPPCDQTDAAGMEEPVEELLSLLDEVPDEPEQLRVISVVGFAGLGKTTLAKVVYGITAAEKFDCSAWVDAGRLTEKTGKVPSASEIISDILEQVRSKDAMDVCSDGKRPDALLMEQLKDKRYLIVIDDIRKGQWNTIKSIFKGSRRSSRILLTTTIHETANLCSYGNGYLYQLKTLGDDDSRKIALPGKQSDELEQSSMALLQKCGGLPLALVSVSDFLKSKSRPTTEELCAKLCRNLGSHLHENENIDDDDFRELRNVLTHNYESLSMNAMNCLLYLGVFPNNRAIKRKVVIRRWLAEGYAWEDSSRRAEDIAEDTFEMLVNRNIIFQTIHTGKNAQMKTCRTHGIMHEFLLHKSLSKSFIATLPRHNPTTITKAYHLSINGGHVTGGEASNLDLSSVRSLSVFGDAGAAISFIDKCKLLRVLDLEECTDLEDCHLKDIRKLWNLRYLSVGNTIEKVPNSVERLHLLETMDLRKSKIKTFPIEAIMMDNLAHLYGTFTIDIENVKSSKKMKDVENFLSKKSNLKTLAGFVTREGQGFLQLMAHIRNLSKVKIWCEPGGNESNYTSALSKAIQKFAEVPIDIVVSRSLSLDSEQCSEDLLSSLYFDPCPEGSKYHISTVKLHGKLPQLPPFVPSLSGLIELSISSTYLTHDLLCSIINSDNLLYLKLIAYQLESFEMKEGALPRLLSLFFVVESHTSAMPVIHEGALPKLVTLQLLGPGLNGISGIPIRHLKHLKEVTVDSGVLDPAKTYWVQATKNHHNRPRLFLGNEEASAARQKRKLCVVHPSLDEPIESSLRRMKLSASSSQHQVIDPPVPSRGVMSMTSNSSKQC